MAYNEDMYLQNLIDRVGEICRRKGWEKDWMGGGCYIHLEVSEFIESLRGKGDSPPESEAADVLFTIMAVMSHYKMRAEDVLFCLEDAIAKKENFDV